MLPVPERVKEVLRQQLLGFRASDDWRISLVATCGLDDLDLLCIVQELEIEFDINIPDVDAERCRTAKDFVTLVERRLAA